MYTVRQVVNIKLTLPVFVILKPNDSIYFKSTAIRIVQMGTNTLSY